MISARTAAILLTALIAASCSSDPTASEEYRALSQEKETVDAHLAYMEEQCDLISAERDALDVAASKQSKDRVPDGVLEAIRGNVDAVNTYDAEAAATNVTDDFIFVSFGTTNSLDEWLELLTNDWQSSHFKITVTGDAIGHSYGDTYVVAEPQRVVWDGTRGLYGYAITTLEDVDGTWLIRKNEWIGEPTNHS